MKKWIKRILVGLAAVLAIVIVVSAVFLLTFDPNAYKDRLQAWVQQRYHRTLTIDGDIDATLFPRLGVSLQGVSLSEPNSSATFASMDSARMDVAIWPLLSRRVVVDHASFTGVKAHVVRDKQGRLNFRDLIGENTSAPGGAQGNAASRGQSAQNPQDTTARRESTSKATPSMTDQQNGAGQQGATGQPDATGRQGSADQQSGAGRQSATGQQSGAERQDATAPAADGVSIDIAGVDIKDGEIQLQDDATGQALTISQLSAKTGRIRAGKPFDVSLSAHVEGTAPRLNADIAGQGVVRLDPQAQRYEVRKLDLKAAGQLPGAHAKNLTARGDLSYEARTGTLDSANLEVVFQGDVANVDGGTASMDASLSADRLRIDPRGEAVQASKVSVRAKGTVSRGPFELALDAPALDISPAAASGSPMSARLRIAGGNGVDIRLSTSDITGNSANISIAQAKLAADIKQPDRAWAVNATSPLTLNLHKRAGALSALVGDIDITGPGLPGGTLRVPYTGSAQADMTRATAALRLDARLDGGKLDLTADATQLSAKPAVKFALSADTLDLDKLIPPQPASARSAPVEGVGGKGGDTQSGGTQTSGTQMGGTHALGTQALGTQALGTQAVGTQALGTQAGATQSGGTAAGTASVSNASSSTTAPSTSSGDGGDIDLSFLIGPSAQGTIEAGRLVARGLAVQNLSAAVKLAQGKLTIAPLTANLYGGKLAGNVSLDAAHDNALATRFTLDGVAVGPLLADVTKRSPLTGTGSVAANLTTRGRQAVSLRDNLGGTVQLRLRDGAIKGFDVAGALRDLKQVISGGKQGAPTDVPADAARQTAFSRMDADFALTQGIAAIRNLDVTSPVLRVSQGSPAVIDLPKGTLDIVANVKIADSPPSYADLRELRGVVVPVHVAGPYDALRYRIDWRAVAGNAVTRVLERALGGNGSDNRQNGESRQDTLRDLGRMLKGITGK